MPTLNELYTNLLATVNDSAKTTHVLVTQVQALNEKQNDILNIVRELQGSQHNTDIELALVRQSVDDIDKIQADINMDIDTIKKEHGNLIFDNNYNKNRWSRIADMCFKVIQGIIIAYALYKLGIAP